jgi:hypothetical protein
MRTAEALAKRIIERVVGGCMIYREDQSARTHDFDLHRIAGTAAAVEVTSITDATVRATFAAIGRRRRIPTRLCTKHWRIHPAADANIKRVAEKADAYLADIEGTGIERFFSSLHASSSPPVAAIWHDLRVQGGRVLPRKESEIVIALPVTGGAYSQSLVLAAMETVASTDDNLEKLAMSGAIERHLAIYVDGSATPVLMALRDLKPPSEPPGLPSEVTDIWLFSETYGENRYVVWCAGPNRPWQRFVLASMPDERLVVVAVRNEIASAPSSGKLKTVSEPETQ